MGIEDQVLHRPPAASKVPDHWSWMPLEVLCEGVFDCPHSTPTLEADGPYLVRSQDIRSGYFRTEDAAHVSMSTYAERIARARPRHGDLLYSREGTYFGIAAEVPPAARLCLGQRMVLIRPRPSVVNFRYLRYWLNSPLMALHTQGHRDGSVAERLNLSTIRALPVPVPPLSEQAVIASILGTLDDKIELNRRMSETLEEMTRALFKSWFVDFDPVRAKFEGREPGLPRLIAELFPARTVQSELGEIPEGWGGGTVGDLCSAIYSGGTPSTKESDYWDGGIPWLSSGETRDKIIIDTERTISKLGVANSSTRLVPALSTVIASAGQGNTRGQTALIAIDSYINQSVVALVADPDRSSPCHLFFDLERRYEEFRRISDAHSSRGSLTTKLLAMSDAVLPPITIIKVFESLAKAQVDRIVTLRRESRFLAALRDTLLPPLTSGELRVRDAEKTIGATD